MHDWAVNSEEIAFSVAGWPPAKNEAKSMLAAGHTHSDRVLKLLAAAKTAMSSQHSPVFGTNPVGLELIVHSPVEPPADATNFLGGVGDVLETKDRRASWITWARWPASPSTRMIDRSHRGYIPVEQRI